MVTAAATRKQAILIIISAPCISRKNYSYLLENGQPLRFSVATARLLISVSLSHLPQEIL